MRRTLATVAVLATLLASTACTGGRSTSKVAGTKVAVGVIAIVDVAPIYLGKAKGFFRKRGIDLDLVPEPGGGPIVTGVLAGKYQFGFSNVTSLMAARAAGVPLKAVASGAASTGRSGRDYSAIVVRDGSPIRTPKDLTGRTIAVNALKNIGDTTVRQSVRKAGGDPKRLQFEAMPFPAMGGALRAGRVDAIWVVEPQLSEAVTAGAQVLASNFVDTAPDLTVALYFTSNDTIAKNPGLVAGFTQAIRDSLKYAEQNPDEVRAVVGTYTPIDDTVRIGMILPDWPQDINRASLQTVAKLGEEDGIFKKPPSLDELLP